MNYQIKQLSSYAEQTLLHLTAGTVHSVYRHTVNLTDGRHILAMQADGSPLSPISLILELSGDDMDSLSVKAGDIVSFDRDGFWIQGAKSPCHFTCANARRHDLKLSAPIDSKSRRVLASGIRDAVSAARTKGFSLLFGQDKISEPDLSPMLLAARDQILLSNELCRQRNFEEAALHLSRLIGLGIGLTPSGDDFLCGVMAGLHFSGKLKHPFALRLQAEIGRRLSDTIDISAAFLSCALDHQYSLPVKLLYGLPSSLEILTAFEQIGHSSGIDTLCGILWSLTHIL